MESLHPGCKPFCFRDNPATRPDASDAAQTLDALRQDKKILNYDFQRLTQGDLQPYAGVLAEVVHALSFAQSVPRPVDSYTDYQAREHVLYERATQGYPVVNVQLVNEKSPLRTANLLHVCLYDALYRALCRQGKVAWDDKATQRQITDLARIIRDALMPNGRAGEIEDNEDEPLGGRHSFHRLQAGYALLGKRLGIPLSACPQLGMRFTVEKEVLDAAEKEFGIDPANPLLVFAYDCERNYARGMADGWVRALMLADTIRVDGIEALTVKQIERLHQACTDEVKSTEGQLMQSAMGAEGTSYGILKTRGLTKEGEKELRDFTAVLNTLSAEALQETDAPLRKAGNELLRVEHLKGIGVHLARRSLFKKAGDDVNHVRQLAEHYLGEFRHAIREAEQQGSAETVREAQLMAIIDLCQALERLHPFDDANGRIFEYLLPNALLLALGHEAYAPCHPYLFDGGSRAQVRQEIEMGQAEVKKLRQAAAAA